MASWWSTVFGSAEKEPAHIAEDKDKEIGGLNFKTALEAHLKWKVRLMGIIDGSNSEVIDPNVVSRDDQCVLGKWLHGEGEKQYKDQQGFQNLVTSHAHFHRCAGNTLDLALDGKTQDAATEIASGAFAKASLDVSRHLMRLWRDLGIEKK